MKVMKLIKTIGISALVSVSATLFSLYAFAAEGEPIKTPGLPIYENHMDSREGILDSNNGAWGSATGKVITADNRTYLQTDEAARTTSNSDDLMRIDIGQTLTEGVVIVQFDVKDIANASGSGLIFNIENESKTALAANKGVSLNSEWKTHKITIDLNLQTIEYDDVTAGGSASASLSGNEFRYVQFRRWNNVYAIDELKVYYQAPEVSGVKFATSDSEFVDYLNAVDDLQSVNLTFNNKMTNTDADIEFVNPNNSSRTAASCEAYGKTLKVVPQNGDFSSVQGCYVYINSVTDIYGGTFKNGKVAELYVPEGYIPSARIIGQHNMDNKANLYNRVFSVSSDVTLKEEGGRKYIQTWGSGASGSNADAIAVKLDEVVASGKFIVEFDTKYVAESNKKLAFSLGTSDKADPAAIESISLTADWVSYKYIIDIDTGEIEVYVDGQFVTGITKSNDNWKTKGVEYLHFLRWTDNWALDEVRAYWVEPAVRGVLYTDIKGNSFEKANELTAYIKSVDVSFVNKMTADNVQAYFVNVTEGGTSETADCTAEGNVLKFVPASGYFKPDCNYELYVTKAYDAYGAKFTSDGRMASLTSGNGGFSVSSLEITEGGSEASIGDIAVGDTIKVEASYVLTNAASERKAIIAFVTLKENKIVDFQQSVVDMNSIGVGNASGTFTVDDVEFDEVSAFIWAYDTREPFISGASVK